MTQLIMHGLGYTGAFAQFSLHYRMLAFLGPEHDGIAPRPSDPPWKQRKEHQARKNIQGKGQQTDM